MKMSEISQKLVMIFVETWHELQSTIEESNIDIPGKCGFLYLVKDLVE